MTDANRQWKILKLAEYIQQMKLKQKCTCPRKLYESAKRYSRNNRVSGSISQKSAFE